MLHSPDFQYCAQINLLGNVQNHNRFVCILYGQNIYIGIGLLQIDTFWDQGFRWTYDCLVQIKTAKQHNLLLDRKSQFAFQSSCELR